MSLEILILSSRLLLILLYSLNVCGIIRMSIKEKGEQQKYCSTKSYIDRCSYHRGSDFLYGFCFLVSH